MTVPLKEALIKSLISKGLLSEPQLKQALRIQEEKGGDLKDILAEHGFVSKEDIISVVSRELGIPPINLSRYKIDPDILKLIPKKLVQDYHIIPVSKIEDVLTIAVEDPLNILALDHVTALTKLKLVPVLASKQDIENVISEYYEEQAYQEIESMVSAMAAPMDLEIVEETQREVFSDTDIVLS
ncbi:MAG: hypothetical protein WC658_04155, partial [Candidatus Omnitrophota bacterium]